MELLDCVRWGQHTSKLPHVRKGKLLQSASILNEFDIHTHNVYEVFYLHLHINSSSTSVVYLFFICSLDSFQFPFSLLLNTLSPKLLGSCLLDLLADRLAPQPHLSIISLKKIPSFFPFTLFSLPSATFAFCPS